MERIDTPFVLDAALLVLLLLGSIGGLWRGIRRELYVATGLLLGYALSVSWATPWAADLRDLWSISSGRSHFLVASAFVVAPVIVLGVVGPRAAERTPPDFAGRVGGALLAIVDLLVGVALIGRWARRDLLGRAAEGDVDRTRLVEWITDELGPVLLGCAIAGIILLLGALWVQRRRGAQFRRATPVRPPDARVHRREQPVLAPEAEKVEPRTSGRGGWASRSAGGRPSDTAATVPIPVVNETSRNGGALPQFDPASTTSPEWLRVSGPAHSAEPVDRCLTCGERLTESDRFCPRCGRSLA